MWYLLLYSATFSHSVSLWFLYILWYPSTSNLIQYARAAGVVILVMKDGKVIEQGDHRTLLAKKGFYATLYNSQFES